MPGVGNDVVDLQAPGAAGKSGDVRFLKKVLTAAEQAEVTGAPEPDRLLWSFWAAKETAYKAASQCNGHVSAAPRHYSVFWEGELPEPHPRVNAQPEGAATAGRVKTPCGTVWVRLFCQTDYLLCIGSAGGPGCLPGLDYGLAPITEKVGPNEVNDPAAASFFVRRMAIARISACLGLAPDEIRIRRRRNARGLEPPRVYIKGAPADFPISLSHHGRFAAYAVLVEAGKAASCPAGHF